MRWWWAGLAVLGGALLVLSTLLVFSDRSVVLRTPTGRSWVAASASEEQFERQVLRAARRTLNVEVHLRTGAWGAGIPAAELGFALDEHSTLRKAKADLAKSRREESWPSATLRRLRQEPRTIEVQPQVVFSEAVAERRLEELAPWIDREPQDAELLIAEHRIIPSLPGAKLSVGASVLRLARLDLSQDEVVELYVETLRPRVSEQDLAPVDVTRVLAAYETSFRGKAGPRAINIRTAGKYLDGAIVLPGEVLSFNERVGRRVHGRGFVDAPVIINDELEQDVGGGVCQVATTLHAAARFGDLEVVARRSHSRPSGYAPLGLDATVIDGKVDLRLRNPYDEPLLVHVSFPSTYVIRVELLGRHPDVQVRHRAAVTATESFARRVWHRPEIPPGTYERKQDGSLGMDVVSVLEVQRDGRTETKRYRSKYYPVPEVYWVGEGARVVDLPAPPEHAEGLVVDGEELGSIASTESEGTARQTTNPSDVPPVVADGEEVL